MLSHRKGVLLDGIGSELVRSSAGGRRKTLSAWLGGAGDMTVIATGSSTARTLADRFAEKRHVKDYGAVWDGSTHPLSELYGTLAEAQVVFPHAVALTDERDWAAAQKCVNLGGIVQFPEGTGLFNRQLDIGNGSASAPSTIQNVQLYGYSVPAGNQLSTPVYGTRLKFTGSSGTDAVVRLKGPITCRIDGFDIDCNSLANSGVWATHIFRSTISNVYVGKHRGVAWLLDAWPTPVSGVFTGASLNVLDHCYCGEPATTSTTSLKIGGTATDAGATDVQRLTVQHCGFIGGNSASSVGVHFEYCDIIHIIDSFFQAGSAAAAACNAKLFKITSSAVHSHYFPQNIHVYGSPIICDAVSGYDIDSNWAEQSGGDGGVFFHSFNKADVEDATNKIPNFRRIYGWTEEGTEFGRVKYKKTDVASRREVISSTTTAQPGSPTFEDVYIIPASATGAAWSTFAVGSFAQYRGAEWVEIVPREGFEAYVKDTDITQSWTGSAWVTTLAGQLASAVVITGGSVTGITDLAIADGGTNASTARGAAANLGVPRVIYHSAVAIPLTGSTAETLIATIPIAAGEMGPNGFVDIDVLWSCTNNANTKTIRARIAASGSGLTGTIIDSGTPTSVAAQRRLIHVANRNSASSQVSGSSGATGGTGSINAPSTAAINTANASEIGITAQLANSGDTVTLECVTARLYYGA